MVFRSQRALRRITNQGLELPSNDEEVFSEDSVSKDVNREDGDNEDFEGILDNTIAQEQDTSNQSPSLKRAFLDHSYANHEEELKQVKQEY